jgi:multidomain signaling protein FimX
MSKPDHTLTLGAQSATIVVLTPGEEVAKRIESHLRNAGRPVRCAWVTDLEDLEDALRSSPDLVLCQAGQPRAEVKEVLALCTRLMPDLPVLMLATKTFGMADTVAAIRLGVRGLVFPGDSLQLEHLEMICMRELQTHHHIRELRTMRAKLADYEQRHEKLMGAMGDAVVRVQEGIVTSANTAFAQLIGQKSTAAFVGNPLLDLIASENQAQIKQFLKFFTQGKAKPEQKLPLVLAREGGDPVKVTATVAISQEDGAPLLELLIAVPKPAAAPPPPPPPKEKTAVVPQAPPPPPEPAAPSSDRLGLFKVLEQAITANVQMHRALVLVMVDNFGAIEQRFGYHESELALEQLMDLIRRRMGPKEHVYRFSTALMALVTSRPSPGEFQALAEALRQDVTAHLFKTDNYEAHLAATVVCYPLSRTDKATTVVDTAVRETRQLSRDGGNRVAVLGAAAEQAQVQAAEQRKAESIRKALAENRLKLAYQSIASLEGGDTHHFDVLARMLDEAGQEVPAKEFIPAAEKHGLIVAIDRWVISKALTVLAKRAGAADTSSLFVRLFRAPVRADHQGGRRPLQVARRAAQAAPAQEGRARDDDPGIDRGEPRRQDQGLRPGHALARRRHRDGPLRLDRGRRQDARAPRAGLRALRLHLHQGLRRPEAAGALRRAHGHRQEEEHRDDRRPGRGRQRDGAPVAARREVHPGLPRAGAGSGAARHRRALMRERFSRDPKKTGAEAPVLRCGYRLNEPAPAAAPRCAARSAGASRTGCGSCR